LVEVLYFADFKSITGREREEIKLSNSNTLMDLIQELIAKYPSLREILLNRKTNTVKDSISIAINHSIIDRDNLNSLRLKQGDKIAFLLPVSGG